MADSRFRIHQLHEGCDLREMPCALFQIKVGAKPHDRLIREIANGARAAVVFVSVGGNMTAVVTLLAKARGGPSGRSTTS